MRIFLTAIMLIFFAGANAGASYINVTQEGTEIGFELDSVYMGEFDLTTPTLAFDFIFTPADSEEYLQSGWIDGGISLDFELTLGDETFGADDLEMHEMDLVGSDELVFRIGLNDSAPFQSIGDGTTDVYVSGTLWLSFETEEDAEEFYDEFNDGNQQLQIIKYGSGIEPELGETIMIPEPVTLSLIGSAGILLLIVRRFL